MRRATIAILVLALFLIAACGPVIEKTAEKNNTKTEEKKTEEKKEEKKEETTELKKEEPKEEPKETPKEEPKGDLPTKKVTEGDLVDFPNLKATDPDGDPISYTFSQPIDSEGQWQTAEGDAGEYKITITASDGKNEVSQDVLIIVEALNKAPVLELAESISVKEGEEVKIVIKATDADGDDVKVSFSGWMNGPSKKTTYSDAGEHEVTVTATDGTHEVTEIVKIMVENVNRAPKLNSIKDVTITEGDKVTLSPIAEDPDKDDLTYTYSKPMNPEGVWSTTDGDVGKYKINVTVSDGDMTDSVAFYLTVESLNKAPIIDVADSMSFDEGDVVDLNPKITDPENDELTITYSGWMSSSTYQTDYEDAGTHEVTIKASDGINTAEKTVSVVVREVNRPPAFDSGSFI